MHGLINFIQDFLLFNFLIENYINKTNFLRRFTRKSNSDRGTARKLNQMCFLSLFSLLFIYFRRVFLLIKFNNVSLDAFYTKICLCLENYVNIHDGNREKRHFIILFKHIFSFTTFYIEQTHYLAKFLMINNMNS